MANGSTEPTDDTDRQCAHCELWYSNRGIMAHEANCSERDTADDQDDDQPDDPDPDPVACPDCGSERDGDGDQIVTAGTMRDYLHQQDQLTDELDQQLQAGALVCTGCLEVFDP